MELLHHLSITSKGSSLDFYKTIERLSSNTGLDIPKSRYTPLRRMLTQWRHLKLLKRGGRTHVNHPDRVAMTGEGELAVRCPSCPYPGINTPLDLSKVPKELWFLFRVMLVMDANFKLKNQLVSSYSRDPGFGIGWAYFVPREKYEKYLLENIHEDEISTCVGFAALAQASTRFSHGLRYTGVGGILCERSDMLMPNGLVNIPKGERYASMDFAFAYSLKTFLVIFYLLLSYDIACQWFINLFSRMSEVWAEDMKPTQSLSLENVVPAVGKFHEPAHLQKDHEQYSFNLIVGVGHSNGEGPERLWASHNALSYSTKPMAPGTRQDVLDDHFAAWNWGKLTNMGHTLMRRYKAAIAERNIQVEAHNGWTARLPQEFVQAWEASCLAWENAPFPKDVENPFEISNEFIGEEEALQELEAEERTRRASGAVAWNDVTAVGFISMGLELEHACILVQDFVKSKTREPGGHGHSSHQRREREEHAIAEQRAPLREKLAIYERLRGIYMPGLLQMLVDIQEDVEQASEVTNPEEACLWLPSSIPSNRRASVCVPELIDIENRIRTAQCNDSIQALRHTLRVKSRMVLFKNANVAGQRPGLRSRAIIDRVHNRAKRYAERYRRAREAKLRLIGPGLWEDVLRVLRNEDVRSYRDQSRYKQGPGRRGTNEDSWEPTEEGDGRDGQGEGDEMILWNDVRPLRSSVTRGEDSSRDGTGETRRLNSWIWTAGPGMSLKDGADEGNEICRSEWCRSLARAKRAQEEVLMLKEEMRRTSLYLQWKERWWKERVYIRDSDVELNSGIKEGLQAYAVKQATLYRELDISFRSVWTTPLKDVSVDGANVGSEKPEGENQDEEDEEDDEEEEDEESPGVDVDNDV
ncbi:hypothetical protein VKT23_006342 [Stygiomarasmius scandens]|uniref:CxC2-like cysteine cluster KDZ transposase-associated domain-containing protein n=1 Tax=Marasmiellus scandens TaxID=2682957 RepID=A0ABR1JQ12_9AGAR